MTHSTNKKHGYIIIKVVRSCKNIPTQASLGPGSSQQAGGAELADQDCRQLSQSLPKVGQELALQIHKLYLVARTKNKKARNVR